MLHAIKLFEDGSGTLLDSIQDVLAVLWLIGQAVGLWGG